MKAKSCVFSGNKEGNKVCFVYVEFKLQQKRYAWLIFKLKNQIKVEKICLEKSKE